MTKKCIGCGAELTLEKGKLGYTKDIESDLCMRCFNIKNYNKYEKVDHLEEINTIIKEVKASNDIVIFVVDVFNLSNKIKEIVDYLNNNVILCITKYDLVDIDESKILNYLNINTLGTIVISSKNNYNLDNLMELIEENKKSNNVYLVGYTNAGKSTLINKIIKNYSNNNYELTTSVLPSTTLDFVKVNVNDNLTLIDTPGIIVSNIIDYLDEEEIKKVIPKKKIKPQIYQIKAEQTIMVDNFLGIKIKPYNTVVFYGADGLKYTRYYNDIETSLKIKKIKVSDNSELIVNGFGIIKIKKQTEVQLYLQGNIDIEIRKALF
ncbi:MAG: 50S ribosome-binding GTPase [Firmicutes bacterium]|nr:50S ribosome-binding GTPase [Bacillota bacterium]